MVMTGEEYLRQQKAELTARQARRAREMKEEAFYTAVGKAYYEKYARAGESVEDLILRVFREGAEEI